MKTQKKKSDNYPGPSCDKVQKEIEDFERQEIEHEIAFSLHKRLSCFSHTLQLVVSKFDTLASPKRCLQAGSHLVKKVCYRALQVACPGTASSRR